MPNKPPPILARPCLANVPKLGDSEPDAFPVACQVCGQSCWQRPALEARATALMGAVFASCTRCAVDGKARRMLEKRA